MTTAPNQCSACLTFDFDSFSVWLHEFGFSSPTHMSKGEFAGRVAVPRILDLLASRNVKATFFIPGHTIKSWPDLVARIADEGHEVSHHGYRHATPVSLERDEEKRELERGIEAIVSAIGREPRGYRSPAWDLSPNSLELLQEFGFAYDSSLMGTDFEPYYCRLGDQPDPDEGYRFGREIDLVEIPVSWSLDDWPYFEVVFEPDPLVGLRSPADVLKMWSADFDYMCGHVPGGVFTATFHPQVIGRGARMTLLEGLIDHIGATPGVEFKTVQSVVDEFRSSHEPRATSHEPKAD